MTTKTKGRIYMPHPGHFIASFDCRFRLNTYVPTGYIVSTVGEYAPPHVATYDPDDPLRDRDYQRDPFQEIGLYRLFETMVFKAKKTKAECCPYEADVERGEVDFEGYNTSGDAMRGHEAMCLKWEKKRARK